VSFIIKPETRIVNIEAKNILTKLALQVIIFARRVNIMTKQSVFIARKGINGEGEAILQTFRLLSYEEQRIAYAILEGMRLQKDLDSQKQNAPQG